MTSTLERLTENEFGLYHNHNIQPNHYELFNRLDNFQAPYLEEKLLKDGVFNSPEEYQEAFREFKKFVGLVAISKEKLGMTSKLVDQVWHQFILFTKAYHEFSQDYIGEYLHHTPETSVTPGDKQGVKRFIELYSSTFGSIPKIWGLKQPEGITGSSCGGCSGGCGGGGCGGGCSACSTCSG